jgi:GH15 family glucan-1,4-alpha-glucosidase
MGMKRCGFTRCWRLISGQRATATLLPPNTAAAAACCGRSKARSGSPSPRPMRIDVALTGQLPRRAVVALGFGSSAEAAAALAISSLMQPFDAALQQQIADWEAWQARCAAAGAILLRGPSDTLAPIGEQFAVSAVVLRAHLDKTYPGAMVASLSVPWGRHRQ